MIIPAYNAAGTIGTALMSVLDQTYGDVEAIVVDDGSEDDTAAIVEAIADTDPRVRLLRQRNLGVAAARNLAIEHAHGEYIAPLDADDIFYPEKLEAQVTRIEAGGSAMGMVYSWWVNVDSEGRVTGATTPLAVEGHVYERMLYVNFIGNASVPLFRRSALDEVGFYDTSMRARGGQGCEDWEITLRVAERYDVGLAPGYFTGYRTVQGSMSHDCDSMARSYELVMEGAWVRDPDLSQALLRWSRGNFYTYLASTSYAGRRYAATLRWMAKAVLVDPLTLLASHTTRLTMRSLVWLAVGPVVSLVFPKREDWVAFKRRFGLGLPEPTTRDAVEAEVEPMPSPWRTGKPFDRVRSRRWEALGEGERDAYRSSARQGFPGVVLSSV